MNMENLVENIETKAEVSMQEPSAFEGVVQLGNRIMGFMEKHPAVPVIVFLGRHFRFDGQGGHQVGMDSGAGGWPRQGISCPGFYPCAQSVGVAAVPREKRSPF